jgi:hypothetical protein
VCGEPRSRGVGSPGFRGVRSMQEVHLLAHWLVVRLAWYLVTGCDCPSASRTHSSEQSGQRPFTSGAATAAAEGGGMVLVSAK